MRCTSSRVPDRWNPLGGSAGRGESVIVPQPGELPSDLDLRRGERGRLGGAGGAGRLERGDRLARGVSGSRMSRYGLLLTYAGRCLPAEEGRTGEAPGAVLGARLVEA